MRKISLILAAALFISSGLLAQSTKTPHINKKQNKQISKINQGVRSGELTKSETTRLVKQEKQLQKHKRIAKSDGVVTLLERVKLNKEAQRLDGKIYKQKHDTQNRK